MLDKLIFVPAGDDVLPVAQFDKAAVVTGDLNENVRIAELGEGVDAVRAVEDDVLVVSRPSARPAAG